MNKEIVKKFKDEFNHWLDDGKIECLIQNENGETKWESKDNIKWDNVWDSGKKELAYSIDNKCNEFKIGFIQEEE